MINYPSFKAGYKTFISTCHIMVDLINNSAGFIAITVAINICVKYIPIIPIWAGYIFIIIAWGIWLVSTLDKIKLIGESKLEKGIILFYILIYTASMVAAGLITLSP